MPVPQIAERLEDRFRVLAQGSSQAPARHETLRTAIGWSHELCTPTERLLWARASVFAGSFEPWAAQQVCAAGPLTSEAVPATLTALVNKSIVVVEGERYRLLDT